jgi:peptide/nickel transport system permease protein
MLQYILKRLSLAALTLLAILLASYFLVRLAPGNPAKGSFLGQNQGAAAGMSADKGAFTRNEALIKKLHLDEPIIVGFYLWLQGIVLHGDFGDSASVDIGRPVTDLIMERLPVTVSLNFWAILVTYILAIPIGIHSAVSKNKKLDAVVTFSLFILYSLMSVWVALLLQSTFCEGGQWPIFPLKGLKATLHPGESTWSYMLETAKHYVLPVICLSYAGFAGLSRYARAGILDVIKQDYIRTARAKGLPEHVVLMKHALRNALIILITLFAGLLPGLVTGSIIIEYIFNIPGMGSLSMMALGSRDIPLMMTLFAFGGFLTLGGIMIADLLYVVVDPRISFESKKA